MGLPWISHGILRTILSRSHSYYPHSIDEETETERLSSLPKVTQLGSCELELNRGLLTSEPMILTTTFCHLIFYIHRPSRREDIHWLDRSHMLMDTDPSPEFWFFWSIKGHFIEHLWRAVLRVRHFDVRHKRSWDVVFSFEEFTVSAFVLPTVLFGNFTVIQGSWEKYMV